MARARNIKPGFFHNEDLAECEPLARLCFAGLWTMADREGRLEDRPKRIKGELFAYDNVDVEPLLAQLAHRGFIARYEVDDVRLVQILKFGKHQNPHHREAPSSLPAVPGYVADALEKPQAEGSSQPSEAPGEPEASPRPAQGSDPMQRGVSRADSGFLIPDPLNLIPDTPVPSSARKSARKAASHRCPQDFALTDTLREWAAIEAPLVDVNRELEKFKDCEFAKPHSDWPATFRTWIRRAVDSGGRGQQRAPSKRDQDTATIGALTGTSNHRSSNAASDHRTIDGHVERLD